MREAWGLYLASIRSVGAIRHNVHTKLSLEKNERITEFTGIQLSTSHLIVFLTSSKIPRCSKPPVLVNVKLTKCQNGQSAEMFIEGVLRRLPNTCSRVAKKVKHENGHETS